MWIRCGCIHAKCMLLVPLFIASLLAIYFFIELMKQIYDKPQVNEVNAHRDKRRNPHVIVAQYIGTGNLLGQLSHDLVDQNNFAPIQNEGENGKPVAIPPREILKMQQQFKINSYNLLASDRIPLNRTLPDVRKKKCLLTAYDDLPSTSIIIVFHNEAWSVLLRTIWSVINRSPRNVLKEILLIDDASNRTFLRESLESYVKTLPVPTKILRLMRREGIIPARLLGANNASGDILTFLDAHCECTIGWLEPLLSRVKENPTNVVCPVIDIISDENFGYMKSFELHWGAFNWQLHFRWYLMNSKDLIKRHADVTQPFPSPAMAGGLFAIDRRYFFKIGSYDEKMKIWGGDNLEMSFRIWQCGGRIEIIPCSHVGHLFRKSSPYTFPGGVGNVLNINLARTALVWMDDWADFFFKYFRIPTNLVNSLDVKERKLLRINLQCKSFEWYLENIWPDNFFPSSKRFFGKLISTHTDSEFYKVYLIIIRNANWTNTSNWTDIANYLNSQLNHFQNLYATLPVFCLKQPPNHSSLHIPYGQAFVGECRNEANMDEMFVGRSDGHLMANEGVCLDSLDNYNNGGNKSAVRIVNCAETTRQLWSYNFRTQQILQKTSNRCLTAPEIAHRKLKKGSVKENYYQTYANSQIYEKNNTFRVYTEPCSTSELQKWILMPFAWK